VQRNRSKHTPAPVRRTAGPERRRPRRTWLPGPSEAVVIVVVILVCAALVATGMSTGAALELAGGSWVLGLRMRRERA
jgi:hypothetical protein